MHPETELCTPQRFTQLFSRIKRRIWIMHRVRSGPFTLTAPFPDSYLATVELGVDDLLFCKYEHILGFSETVAFARKWKVDAVAILSGKIRFTALHGPGTVILFGAGGLIPHQLNDSGHADFDRNSVVAWTKSLAVGIHTRSSLWSAILYKDDILLDRFDGDGTVVVQSSTQRITAANFQSANGTTSIIDYINAIVGLR